VAAILEYGDTKKEINGGVIATTNNRMELAAAIEALSRLKEPCEVELFTDSEYLRDGITKWIHAWKAKGWKKKVKNKDLWEALDVAASRHKIEWHWIRGHVGNSRNERCDLLATQEAQKFRAKHTPAELKGACDEFLAQRAQVPNESEVPSAKTPQLL
jgi:ribonuclease HI